MDIGHRLDFTRHNQESNWRTGMPEDIEIENPDIYLLGKGSQYKYYIHDLKCSACFNFIANLEGKACMFCNIFIFKWKHL